MGDCRNTVYLWAPGGDLAVLPANSGIAIGAGDGYKAFSLQIHYNNPDVRKCKCRFSLDAPSRFFFCLLKPFLYNTYSTGG
jgi:hypothetical protein